MVRCDALVVGGGFKSIAAAWGLARQGQSVVLVEQSAKIGGFLSPIHWDGYWIDKGPQFFDNFEAQDVDMMSEMLGPDVMQDIGFEYGSFMAGKLNSDFAIPDWQSLGDDVASNAFQSLFAQRLAASGSSPAFKSLDDVLMFDGGPVLYPHLKKLAKKFVRRDAEEVSPRTASMVSFLGRKKFFDQELSLDLKQSPFMDAFLAAKKVSVDGSRVNLYPKGDSLERVRNALEDALQREGVTVMVEATLAGFDDARGVAETSAGEISYGRVVFGTDIRESERILTGGSTIADCTHVLPEIFHCFVVPADTVAAPYYVVDYDPDHLTSRITNFLNYMGCVGDDGYGVICVEEPIEKDDARWNDPEAELGRIFAEACETGTVSAKNYRQAKSFRIPATYKFPLVGIEGAVDAFSDQMMARFGESIVLPDAYALTRKEAINDLRTLGILV
ncbi:MAG: NAD(P)-binding protein [Silicimonas sp.]|nr:NAD(P)-binding protein [Silicimonas sp.]